MHKGIAYRLHRVSRAAMFFGKTGRYRFDDPDRKFGVLYVAETPLGAFAETLLPEPGALTPTVAIPAGTVPISAAALGSYTLSVVRFARPIRCVDLAGPGLARIGADGRLTSGDWSIAQRWGRALFSHPDRPDAIPYRARHDQAQLAFAVHDRARKIVDSTSQGRLLDAKNRQILDALIERYTLAIIPSAD